MTQTLKGPSEILLAGCQSTMFRVNVDKGEIIETLTAENHYTLLKHGGQYVCAATIDGSVQILDGKSFIVLKTWKAHLGWINDMDANALFLVTCGWSPRQQLGHMLDPLAKVFDLKTLMPLPPVAFHVGAAFIRMHPRMLTTAIIASQSGQLQIVDVMNMSMVNVRHLNLVDSFLMGLEISPIGSVLALADSLCCLQLWGNPSSLSFTDYGQATEFADEVDYMTPTLEWESNKPLSTIGMPYYREILLSAWPSYMTFEVGAPPAKMDPAMLAALTKAGLGAYGPNPRARRRNQVEETRIASPETEGLQGPKFLSEQAKDGEEEFDHARRMSAILDAMDASNLEGNLKIDVPVMYRNVEIKYSRFGVDDFDFEYYNKTRFSGLETHIANSYANPLLQLLRFTPWLRNLALHHTASACLFETCLLCEMGFLFDMLEKAEGQNCQATNFLKTFSSLSHTASLGLLEESSSARPLTLMIQAANRFLLDKVATDFRQTSIQAPRMDQVLTTVAVNTIRCAHCANETMRPGGSYLHDLVYPPRTPTKPHLRVNGPSFSQILKGSVERQDQTRGWCDRCKRYQHLGARKTIQAVPPVLMINAAVHSSEAKRLWAKADWLPEEIGIIVDQGQFFCYEGQDLQVHLKRGVFKIAVYELVGVVADINSGENQKSHLVSMINISPSLREKTTENRWHLFNDFLVRQIPVDEALRFDPLWKVPSILTYQIKSARHAIDDTWKQTLDTSLLYRKWSMQQTEDPLHFRPLSFPLERPQPETAVGIDAEFVALQQEELEIKADGSRSILRPSRLGLARVSVLRGDSSSAKDDTAPYNQPQEATQQETHVPFIDDYIHISEPITDYLTAFSGIYPGDLSPATSPYMSTGRLVSLKTAYKKLWLLLNLGCVFVGHGLPKDFRTINIRVPREQVIDTVDLFYDRRRGGGRKLSLRFLSWLLLGVRVQEEEPFTGDENSNTADASKSERIAGHDSIVDAKMALLLWAKWKEAERANRTEKLLEEVYRKGREHGFKVPPRGGYTLGHSKSRSDAASGSERGSAPGTPAGRAAGLVPTKAITEG
ncbi:MAG: poly(A)-specific ribonuclease [Chrysothrix sp. TS-e1954]|nr:MAG: poly(A)-specific ribonuclease [Chrysothrix sp. TS-e1954]